MTDVYRELGEYIAADIARWTKLARERKIELDA